MRTMSGIANKKNDTYVYLDYAAATPVSAVAREAYEDALQYFANPQALHTPGLQAAQVHNDARATVAHVLGVKSSDLTFTSGGTEGNNLCLAGFISACVAAGRKLEDCHVVVSEIEHPSVLEVLAPFVARGMPTTFVAPNKHGEIRPEAVAAALQENTVLVSVAIINSEIGTAQPIHAISQMLKKDAPHVRLHVDACQGLYHSLVAQGLGADLLVLDSGKVYGPRGAGVVYVRRGTALEPVVRGGSQESGLRGGTENVALMAGFAAALKETHVMRKDEYVRLRAIREALVEGLAQGIEGLVINGTGKEQSPHILNISIPNIHAEYIVAYLDQRGFGLTTKSACLEQGDVAESHVVRSLVNVTGKEEDWRAQNTLRISLGRETKESDVPNIIKAVVEAVQHYQSFEHNS